jgi:hypothetical protein
VNSEAAEKIANAVLYEGYMLYPYRRSSIKNQQRWNFGTLYPQAFDEVRRGTERSTMQVECLLQSAADTRVMIRGRFLQFGVNADAPESAVERAVELKADFTGSAPFLDFSFPGYNGKVIGKMTVTAETVAENLRKLHVELRNEYSASPDTARDQILPNSLVSAHLLLEAEDGDFVSLLDPPEEFRDAVTGCRNEGCFPVLVGDEGQTNLLLASPIILYDYPQIAPESAGDFFDGTEMDEMLTLRVMTMTDHEKNEMRSADDRTRALLERTEQTAREQLARTHGVIRSMGDDVTKQ